MKSLWIITILLIYGPSSFTMTDKEMDDEAYAKFFALVVNAHALNPTANPDDIAQSMHLPTPPFLFTDDGHRDLRADLVITRTYERIRVTRAASSIANPNQTQPSQLPMEDKPTEVLNIYKYPYQQCFIPAQDHPTTSSMNDHIDATHEDKKDLRTQKASIQRHSDNMHENSFFKCPHCRFETRYKYYLPEHMMRKHHIRVPSNDSPSDDGSLIIDNDDSNGDGDGDDDPRLSVVIGKNNDKSHLIAIKQ